MELPRYHRLIPALYRLKGTRCVECGELAYPANPRCNSCGNYEREKYFFKGNGTLLTFSEVFAAPSGHAGRPYFTGLVRLAEGITVAAQLTDVEPEDLHTGMQVEAVLRRIGDTQSHGLIVYGTKFRPAKVLLDQPEGDI